MIPLLATAFFVGISTNSLAAPTVGGNCTKLNSLTQIAGVTYSCNKVGKKMIWGPQASGSAMPNKAPSTVPLTAQSSIATPALTPRSAFADVSTCKLHSPIPVNNLGFPRDSSLIPTTGNHRAIALFVDFSDVKGDPSMFDEWRLHQIPTMEKTYSAMSYGKLNYIIDVQPEIFHINKDSIAYYLNTPHDQPASPKANASQLVLDAMSAADPKVDFSKYDFVNVITPITPNILYEGAIGMSGTFDGKTFTEATFGTEREYMDQAQKANWLVHETGHLMGLIHNYDEADTKGNYRAQGFQLPAWDAMTFPLTTTPDFFAWSKFILGWIDDTRVDCLSPSSPSSVHLITPTGDKSTGTKLVAVKLDDENILVIESRRASSLDKLTSSQEGILVYKVNMTTPASLGAVELLFNKPNVGLIPGDKKKWGSSATFQVGYCNIVPQETLRTQGFEIKYLKRSNVGDYVSISKIA